MSCDIVFTDKKTIEDHHATELQRPNDNGLKVAIHFNSFNLFKIKPFKSFIH